jgi:hypothetical protein
VKHLSVLAQHDLVVSEDVLEDELAGALEILQKQGQKSVIDALLDKASRNELNSAEKRELARHLSSQR